VIAGLLLVARGHEAAHELPCSSVDRILAATKASRTRAYEIKQAIEAQLAELERPPGRPRAEPAPAPLDPRVALLHELVCFLMAHPGCLQVGEQRARYSDVYRHFVLGLRERHADIAAADFAHALAIPLGTLEDWLRSPLRSPPTDEPCNAGTAAPCDTSANDAIPDPVQSKTLDARQAQIETVLTAWRAWHGSFSAFCAHIRSDHRLELGATLIASILFEYGLRVPARRNGRSRDDEALRNSFEIVTSGSMLPPTSSRPFRLTSASTWPSAPRGASTPPSRSRRATALTSSVASCAGSGRSRSAIQSRRASRVLRSSDPHAASTLQALLVLHLTPPPVVRHSGLVGD
jgi:hypothetical protein